MAFAAATSAAGRQPDLLHPARGRCCAGRARGPGCSTGSNAVGCCTMPASSAACGRVSVAGVGAEVAPGGGLDAVGAVAEVGDVEVALEDLLLGVLAPRARRRSAARAACGCTTARWPPSPPRPASCRPRSRRRLEQHLLDVLLGQRRAALHVAAGLVVDERAQRAAQVDAAVVVEPRVLDGHHGLAHDLGDVGQRHRHPVLVVERGDRASRRRPGSGTARAAAGSRARRAATRSPRRCRGPPGPARRRRGAATPATRSAGRARSRAGTG